MMLWAIAWMLGGYITTLNKIFWQELSYWNEVISVVYFMFAFAVSAYHMKHNATTSTPENDSESGSENGKIVRLFWYKLYS